ncbi:MAG: GTP-binding protein LepA [Myxococcales bacterium]|nr:GTP-binding protein LepA [Myxococcales bacterium]
MRDRDVHRESSIETEPQPLHHEEAVTPTRYVDGPIPPVQLADASSSAPTASEQGYDGQDKNVEELKRKVGGLVAAKFGGSYKRAFEHYDADHDGGITKSELTALLGDAGVGNGITRGVWASKIIDKLDKSGDQKVEWTEFESVFTGAAATALG